MRKYFYKDSAGNIKKYIYCLRGCSQPYKQEDIGRSILKSSDTTFLCHRCVQELNLNSTLRGTPRSYSGTTADEILESVNFNTEFETQEKIKEEIVQETETPQKAEIQEQEICTTETKENSSFYGIVVQCNDLSYYFGVTTNVEKAIKNHNSGCGSTYTKKRRPVRLVTFKEASSFDEAKKAREEFRLIYRNT